MLVSLHSIIIIIIQTNGSSYKVNKILFNCVNP